MKHVLEAFSNHDAHGWQCREGNPGIFGSFLLASTCWHGKIAIFHSVHVCWPHIRILEYSGWQYHIRNSNFSNIRWTLYQWQIATRNCFFKPPHLKGGSLGVAELVGWMRRTISNMPNSLVARPARVPSTIFRPALWFSRSSYGNCHLSANKLTGNFFLGF